MSDNDDFKEVPRQLWGIDLAHKHVEGYKEILSITVGANETSKFWLGMLNDLKNRGVQDVLFFCVDGLPGLDRKSVV